MFYLLNNVGMDEGKLQSASKLAAALAEIG